MPKLLVKHYKLVDNKYSAAAVPLEPEELRKWFTQIPFCVCGAVSLWTQISLVRLYFKQSVKRYDEPLVWTEFEKQNC